MGDIDLVEGATICRCLLSPHDPNCPVAALDRIARVVDAASNLSDAPHTATAPFFVALRVALEALDA